MHVTRRKLLVDGLRVTALLPGLGLLRARPRPSTGGRVLLVVQLTGGNDGLNTVVPRRQDAYFRSRPTLAQKPGTVHALDDDHGLHPAMGALGALFGEGRLGIVHGVGCPEPDRSHFRSLEVWHAGDPRGDVDGTGWLGRMADHLAAEQPGSMPALHVGDEDLPLALRGRTAAPSSLTDETSLRLAELPGLERWRESLLARGAGDAGDLAFLRDAAHTACEASRRLDAAVARADAGDYPDLGLARKLRLVARVVRGGFDTRCFLVTLGGFDTHARQAPLHAALLEELSGSLAAFQRDLARDGLEERVLTMVYSEFGRRVAENGSRGTDHGAAAPVLLVGAPGTGGLRGTPPDLERLVDGDVPCTTDFRALYGALEQDWLRLPSSYPVPRLDLGV